MIQTTFNREETIEWLLRHTHETHNGCLELYDDFWTDFWGDYPLIHWNGRTMNICRFICFEPDEWRCNLVTRHRCHNKKCINREHLIKGTHSDNIRDNGYEPFEMPDSYDSMFSNDKDDWWDDPSDDELEKEYRQYEKEMEDDAQEDWA